MGRVVIKLRFGAWRPLRGLLQCCGYMLGWARMGGGGGILPFNLHCEFVMHDRFRQEIREFSCIGSSQT